jgi:hypothetical protein
LGSLFPFRPHFSSSPRFKSASNLIRKNPTHIKPPPLLDSSFPFPLVLRHLGIGGQQATRPPVSKLSVGVFTSGGFGIVPSRHAQVSFDALPFVSNRVVSRAGYLTMRDNRGNLSNSREAAAAIARHLVICVYFLGRCFGCHRFLRRSRAALPACRRIALHPRPWLPRPSARR